MKKYIETGEIVGTHGIKGEMRVQPWSDTPDFICDFKTLYTSADGKTSVEIESTRVHKRIVLLKVKGVDTIEQAEKLRGKVLYIDREDTVLPEGVEFIQDLLDCEVYHFESGELLGTLTDVFATGANDVWQISKDGRDYLIPAVPEVVKNTDTKNGRIEIIPIAGIFDEPEKVKPDDAG